LPVLAAAASGFLEAGTLRAAFSQAPGGDSYTWLLDPAPLPQHAVIPLLEIHGWEELKHFSQKQRELILKISGFSETAWGSRGVELGTDLPQGLWAASIQQALDEFGSHPHILQKFHKGRLIAHPYRDRAGEMRTMQGRVRLCPYILSSTARPTCAARLQRSAPPTRSCCTE